ncbi:MAG: ROK family protein [Blastocatellales bacterium]
MPAAKKKSSKNKRAKKFIRTLAIDIGGSRLKASILDEHGEMVTERVRVDTPKPCPPKAMLAALKKLVSQLPDFDRVSVGFPGVVHHGKILMAANLGTRYWKGFDLEKALARMLKKPVKVINDADMQGLAAIRGNGVEMVITLGTGVGCGLFEDGRLAPHLEIGHIPFRNDQTFEQQLGAKPLAEIGKARWNRRLKKAIGYWRILTSFEKLYLGGGNAQLVSFKLPPDVEIVPNVLGMKGGIWLWKERGK